MRFTTIHTVSPYLDTAPADYPREVRFQLGADGTSVRIVSVESDESEVIRFEAGPYRAGAMGRDDSEQAADVWSFAVAYAERPEEFERDPEDLDQVHAAWFAEHGDAVACELPE